MSFKSGTTMTVINVASVLVHMNGVDNGATFLERFCTGPRRDWRVSGKTQKALSNPTASYMGYPHPVLVHPDRTIAGNYLSGTGYEDVAVLAIRSYPPSDNQLSGFQHIIRDLIRVSVKQGKTKIIFDLRGNGGGYTILGYGLFKQVFPQADQVPFDGKRYRANEALKLVGLITQEFNKNKIFVQTNQTAFDDRLPYYTTQDIMCLTHGFNYLHHLDVNNERIASWQELYGPEDINGDLFTTITRQKFSDELSAGLPFIESMININKTATTQPLKSENIVMLHDGMCSSTCAAASELLKDQGGVRTIVIGGQHKFGPMQGVAGTKGGQLYGWDNIRLLTEIAYKLGSPQEQTKWNTTALGKTAFATQIFARSDYEDNFWPWGKIDFYSGINLRDNMRRNDASKTPLQFIYEAADCRMWYTPPMITDVTMVWKGVVDRMFKDNGIRLCVQEVRDTRIASLDVSRANDGEKRLQTSLEM